MLQPDRPQMRIWRMRIACWITMATDTPSEYVIVTAFARQTRTRLMVLLCMRYLSCVFHGALSQNVDLGSV